MDTRTNSNPANPQTVTYAACPQCLKLNKISLARAHGTKPVCGACKTEIDLHGPILNAGTQQLQKLIEKSPLPIIVDFWAPWCAPCRSFAPNFERVASEFSGRAVFVKVNTEDNVFASQAFGIRGIPALIAFKDGHEIARQAGALPYEHFKAWTRQFV